MLEPELRWDKCLQVLRYWKITFLTEARQRMTWMSVLNRFQFFFTCEMYIQHLRQKIVLSKNENETGEVSFCLAVVW